MGNARHREVLRLAVGDGVSRSVAHVYSVGQVVARSGLQHVVLQGVHESALGRYGVVCQGEGVGIKPDVAALYAKLGLLGGIEQRAGVANRRSHGAGIDADKHAHIQCGCQGAICAHVFIEECSPGLLGERDIGTQINTSDIGHGVLGRQLGRLSVQTAGECLPDHGNALGACISSTLGTGITGNDTVDLGELTPFGIAWLRQRRIQDCKDIGTNSNTVQPDVPALWMRAGGMVRRNLHKKPSVGQHAIFDDLDAKDLVRQFFTQASSHLGYELLPIAAARTGPVKAARGFYFIGAQGHATQIELDHVTAGQGHRGALYRGQCWLDRLDRLDWGRVVEIKRHVVMLRDLIQHVVEISVVVRVVKTQCVIAPVARYGLAPGERAKVISRALILPSKGDVEVTQRIKGQLQQPRIHQEVDHLLKITLILRKFEGAQELRISHLACRAIHSHRQTCRRSKGRSWPRGLSSLSARRR